MTTKNTFDIKESAATATANTTLSISSEQNNTIDEPSGPVGPVGLVRPVGSANSQTTNNQFQTTGLSNMSISHNVANRKKLKIMKDTPIINDYQSILDITISDTDKEYVIKSIFYNMAYNLFFMFICFTF